MKMNWKPCLVNLILIGIVETIVVSVAYAICHEPPYLEKALPKKSESMTTRYETGAVVSYGCYPGYGKISGQGISRCQESGKWSIPDIECQAISCGIPTIPEHGRIKGTEYVFGKTVRFECFEGYQLWSKDGITELDVSPVLLCGADGEWNGQIPICLPVQCPVPQDVPNSEKYVQSTEYGGKVSYACHQGFRHNLGDLERRCQLDGTWSGIPPVCNDIKCIDPETEGYLSKYPDVEQCEVLSALEPGDEARCTCKHRQGEVIIKCLDNGEWEDPCKEIECPVPQKIPNSERNIQSRQLGGKVIYKCLKGFRHHSGNLERRCQQDETWSGIPPICTEIECPVPQVVPNSKKCFQNTQFGGKVIYKCLKGFQHQSGDLERWCQSDETWSGISPICNAEVPEEKPGLLERIENGLKRVGKAICNFFGGNC